jgi:hypothetical protein
MIFPLEFPSSHSTFGMHFCGAAFSLDIEESPETVHESGRGKAFER